MKVCTDACLFGAWVADKVKGKELVNRNCLDIGTGTGLLSLMLAQQTDLLIDAVEIEEAAAAQAADNFELSPWKNRLQLIPGDMRSIHLGRKYGLIISNPPFFEQDLKSPDTRRNLALHSEALSLEELIGIARQHLADHGSFAVLLPYERKEECIAVAAAARLFLVAATSVKQSDRHSFFRVMLLFSTEPAVAQHAEITIREKDNYSESFQNLLRAYYLKR